MWLPRQLKGDMIFCGRSSDWAALNLPLAFTTGKKGRREKSLIQSFCIMCFYLHASEQKRFSSSYIRSYTWAIPCQSMWQLQIVCTNSRGVWTNIWRRDPLLGGKGGLLIRQTTSNSGNPLSWKCLKAAWMFGRKYFISLPCSYFTLDIHLLPFLGKRFWTLICRSSLTHILRRDFPYCWAIKLMNS